MLDRFWRKILFTALHIHAGRYMFDDVEFAVFIEGYT